MTNDGITRINVCFPKDDTTTLARIDEIRGQQSRSQVLHRLIEYAVNNWNDDTVRDIVRVRVPKVQCLS